jgi:hypothetical protein
MSKSKVRMKVGMKGVWYEACASEGHCSFYFGRDREEPCKSFQVFQIEEGYIGDIDISGVLAIHVVDLYSNKAADLMTKGGEGGIYISENTSEEQRKYLEALWGSGDAAGQMVKKILGIRYVDIKLSQEGKTYHIKMPYGELKLSLTTGMDGKNPQRIENSPFGVFFNDIKICNTHFWKYNDFGKNWYFENRSGTIATFGPGESKVKLAF